MNFLLKEYIELLNHRMYGGVKYNRNLLHVHYSAIIPYEKILSCLEQKYKNKVKFYDGRKLRFEDNNDKIDWKEIEKIMKELDWSKKAPMFYHIIKSNIFFEDYNLLILDELDLQQILNVEFRIRLGSFENISIEDELKMFYEIRKTWLNRNHDFRIIFQTCKSTSNKEIVKYMMEVNNLFKKYDWVRNIICGFDIACNEVTGRKLSDFEFIIKNMNMPPIFHAGEHGNINKLLNNIKFSIKVGCKRIGHGIYAVKDKNVLKELKEKDICLELCPLSNLLLNVTRNENELIEIYNKIMESEIPYCINSDDPNKLNNYDLEDNYKWCEKNINNFNRKLSEENSIKYSFIK